MVSASPDLLDLTPKVLAIEQYLGALDAALVSQDPAAVEVATGSLHRALADAMAAFRHAVQAGHDPLTPELRQKLLLAQARVSGQQATAARAVGSIERTLKVLLPQETESSTYSDLAAKAGPQGLKGYSA
ncbi:MAG: hypothetical protein KGL90_01185 [Burkholderiales bacterium]|nr:hypothetical protein [Burkholderiales bacterium]